MEKRGYRQNLEMLLEKFPSTKWLSQAEIARAFEIDRRTVKRRFGIDGNGISVSDLARRITQ